MHERLYALSSPWAQHLEGSYIPKEALRHVDPSRSQYLYLDNGASELIRDNHCNTAAVRWTVREHGVILAGQDPKSLIDPVSGEQLGDEAVRRLHEYAEWAATPQVRDSMDRWTQPYLVLSFCRMLHTLRSGKVVSKREAGTWALTTLDPGWRELIQRALDDRPDPWDRVHQPADSEAADRTLAFIDYALREGARLRCGEAK
jgi:hypothetical protein